MILTMKRLFFFLTSFAFYWATLGLAVLLLAGAGAGLVMALAYWQGWTLVPPPEWMRTTGAVVLTCAAAWMVWGDVRDGRGA
jgi:ABC-type nickel/cobalt efflux system permease component RcnA